MAHDPETCCLSAIHDEIAALKNDVVGLDMRLDAVENEVPDVEPIPGPPGPPGPQGEPGPAGSGTGGGAGVVVKSGIAMMAALRDGLSPIYVDGRISWPSYFEVKKPGTEIIGINDGTICSTFEDRAALNYNHVLFVNCSHVRIRNVRITSIHGGTFDGFVPVTQLGTCEPGGSKITGLDTSKLKVGLRVTGYGTIGTIVSIDSPTQVTINTKSENGWDFPVPLTFQANCGSHMGITLPCSPSYAADDITIQQCRFDHLYIGIYRPGGPNGLPTTNIRILDCTFENFYHSGILTNWQCNNWWVHRCRLLGRANGETHSVAHNCIGMFGLHSHISIRDCECAYGERMGIETAFTMEYVDTSFNHCHDLGSMGISLGYSRNSQVNFNCVERVRDIGIEFGGAYDDKISRCNLRGIGNNIRGVSPTVSISCGITVDQVLQVILQANHIEDIQPAAGGASASGIEVVNGGGEAHITSNVLRRCGQAFIRLNHSAPRCFLADNDFYSEVGDGNPYAVASYDSKSTVVNNRAYVPTGQVTAFYAQGGSIQNAPGQFTSSGNYLGTNTVFDLTTGEVIA